MNLSVGIVGLPNAGKSTLFNALLTKPSAKVAAFPFTTIDKNIGVVNVPDETLFKLAVLEGIEKVTPATITFVDIAGLIKGAHEGEGLGNQFLHHIREVDLIFHVVRFFKDENVPHVHQKIDPEDDVEIVNDELLLADIATLEKRLQDKKIDPKEKQILQKYREKLNQGTLARDVASTDEEKVIIGQLNLLTAKKQLLVANVGEDEIAGSYTYLSICARLESELTEFPWTEQQRMLKELGLPKERAKEQIILEAYKALDLVTFYTIAKKKEARAWPIRKGATALEAAGKVHTDFVKHFVKVEAINVYELLKLGSWHKAHELGKIALHGRDYLVQNQDVLEFKVALKS